MDRGHFHTNIMLDLECCHVKAPNPAIIEIAAVHFDIDTARELANFTTIVDLQSCLDVGLVAEEAKSPDDEDGDTDVYSSDDGCSDGWGEKKKRERTMVWLEDNIPMTLKKSREGGGISLPQALSRFNGFIRESVQRTHEALSRNGRGYLIDYSRPMIWGNGAVADNVWIRSAYRACKMKKPWKFFHDMCVRTFVRQCSLLTGTNYKKEEELVYKRKAHIALDDCRFQISYLVKARKDVTPPSRAISSDALNPEVMETLQSKPNYSELTIVRSQPNEIDEIPQTSWVESPRWTILDHVLAEEIAKSAPVNEDYHSQARGSQEDNSSTDPSLMNSIPNNVSSIVNTSLTNDNPLSQTFQKPANTDIKPAEHLSPPLSQNSPSSSQIPLPSQHPPPSQYRLPLETSFSFPEKGDVESKANIPLTPQAPKPYLPTPETSFCSNDLNCDCKEDLANVKRDQTSPPPSKRQCI